jgi:hypothetical protein
VSDSSFRLKPSPFAGDIATGLYELPQRTGEAHLYRLNHPLAEALLRRRTPANWLPVRWFFTTTSITAKFDTRTAAGRRGMVGFVYI